MRVPFARPRRATSIWAASSRVGERMRARVRPGDCFMSRCRIGRRNAAVFPDPVCAVPITSRPDRMAGVAPFLIGGGGSEPGAETARRGAGTRPGKAEGVFGGGAWLGGSQGYYG